MKKIHTIAFTTMALLLGMAIPSYGMDSATLHDQPGRYRVLLANGEKVIYGDMDSLATQETRDLPSSIENMSLTLYQENYAVNPDAMAFAMGKTVTSISEYQAVLYGNKANYQFKLQPSLTACYTPQGEALEKKDNQKFLSQAEVEDVYRTLFRLIRTRN